MKITLSNLPKSVCLIALATSFVAVNAVAEPAKSSLQLCEEKTKAFLKTN